MAPLQPSSDSVGPQEDRKRRTPSIVRRFSDLDKTGDGQIRRDDLAAALTRTATVRTANRHADDIIEKYGQSKPGGLGIDEFAKFVDDRRCELGAIFHELDISGKGRISHEDVKHGLKNANVQFMDSDVDRVLSRFGAGRASSGEGVTFQQFFEASFLLPRLTSRDLLLSTTAGVLSLTAPPPGTTPMMIVLAGVINGMVSRTATAPMDRLRAILATGREASIKDAFWSIYSTQGVRGFWASNLANVVQVAPENGIAFALNDLLRDYMCVDPVQPTVPEKFILGSTAGAIAMTAVYPMYVVQNRMAAARHGQYAGFLDCVRRTGFAYPGFCTALIRVLPLKGIMLGGYGTLKDFVKDPVTGDISTAKSLACSAAAGGMAHSVTYPLHVARTVLQQEVEPGGRVYTGFVDVLRHRLQTHGPRGWFLGLPVWLCNRVPAVAIEFAVNERALDAMRWLAS